MTVAARWATCATVLATSAWAQAPATWQLPQGGAARYHASEDLDPEPDGPSLPGCVLPHATMILHRELARAGTHLRIAPQDWRWIAPLLAFDLRLPTVGKVTLRLEGVPHLGDLEVRGTATTAAAGQTFALQFDVVARSEAGFGGKGAGTLELVRNVTDGVVTDFRAVSTLQLELGPLQQRAAVRGTFTQDWRLDRIVEHRQKDFVATVARAIVAGAEPIRFALRPERAEFATQPAGKDHPCGEGRLALGIHTLLTAGVPKDDPAILAGLAELRRRQIRETYSLCTAILALDALYAPAGEPDALRSGALAAPIPRQLDAGDASLLAEWTQRLRDNRDSNGKKVARWWYLGGQGFDNSNSQYALLGLWQAQWCQQETPTELWRAAARHWQASQHRSAGPARALHLIGPKAFAEYGLAALRQAGSAPTAAPRGFGYTTNDDGPAYGSMTAAGVTGLALCRAALTVEGGRVDARLDASLRSGFAWLSQHRSVRCNPGPVARQHEFFFYWLYSLERACQLAHVTLLDDWDWYHDGAQVLMQMQDHDGAFGPATFEQQCFAVLFLGRAQLAAQTGSLTNPR